MTLSFKDEVNSVTNQENANETKTIQTEEFNLSYQHRPNCKVHFDITLPPSVIKTLHEKALKNVAKEVSIPGFRKGKAPKEFILEKFQKGIHSELLTLSLEQTLQYIVKATNIRPLNNEISGKPKIHYCDTEKGAHIELSYDTYPVIPPIDPSSIEIQESLPEMITEEKIQEEIDHVGWSAATFEPIADRAVESDDAIRVNFFYSFDEKDWLQSLDSSKRILLSSKVFPDEIKERLIGLNVDDTVEGIYQSPKSDNTPMHYRITICAIEHGTYPDMEEFAKKNGLKDSQELRTKISERLNSEAFLFAYQNNMNQLKEILINKYFFDLPTHVILEGFKNEYEEALAEFKETHSNQHITQELAENLKTQMLNSKVKEYIFSYLINKFTDERKIEINESDLLNEINFQTYPPSNYTAEFSFDMNKNEAAQRLQFLAKRRKAMELIFDESKRASTPMS